ncbi:MAG: hypothetical protein ACFB21_16700 [Opitutales bacterium]
MNAFLRNLITAAWVLLFIPVIFTVPVLFRWFAALVSLAFGEPVELWGEASLLFAIFVILLAGYPIAYGVFLGKVVVRWEEGLRARAYPLVVPFLWGGITFILSSLVGGEG